MRCAFCVIFWTRRVSASSTQVCVQRCDAGTAAEACSGVTRCRVDGVVVWQLGELWPGVPVVTNRFSRRAKLSIMLASRCERHHLQTLLQSSYVPLCQPCLDLDVIR